MDEPIEHDKAWYKKNFEFYRSACYHQQKVNKEKQSRIWQLESQVAELENEISKLEAKKNETKK